MDFNGTWVRRGYFDFSSDDHRRAPTQAIRKDLAMAIGLSADALKIRSFPVGPAWRHTFWWREGDSDYAEAQFFMQIAHYPVLSLGVSVEKGREDAVAAGDKLMNRRSWDWQRFVDHCAIIFETDVPAAAANLPQPVNLRVQLLPRGVERAGLDDRSFSFVDGRWYERLRGSADVGAIRDYARAVDQLQDCWGLVYFAMDLSPEAVEGVSPSTVARYLSAFEPIRQRLRGVQVAGAV